MNEQQLLEDGHVYYFECVDKKANCLFSVAIPDEYPGPVKPAQKIPN